MRHAGLSLAPASVCSWHSSGYRKLLVLAYPGPTQGSSMSSGIPVAPKVHVVRTSDYQVGFQSEAAPK